MKAKSWKENEHKLIIKILALLHAPYSLRDKQVGKLWQVQELLNEYLNDSLKK